MTINYRTATVEDLAALRSFEQGVIRAERPYNSSIRPDPVSYYDIAELIQGEDSVVMVADVDGRIVASGYGLIRDSRPYFDHKVHTYLGFMYVIPDFRGLGINKEIIRCLSDWSKARGIQYLYLDVYAENTNAIKAYEKVGFESSIINMKKKLW